LRTNILALITAVLLVGLAAPTLGFSERNFVNHNLDWQKDVIRIHRDGSNATPRQLNSKLTRIINRTGQYIDWLRTIDATPCQNDAGFIAHFNATVGFHNKELAAVRASAGGNYSRAAFWLGKATAAYKFGNQSAIRVLRAC
jgi:hypothetical protein